MMVGGADPFGLESYQRNPCKDSNPSLVCSLPPLHHATWALEEEIFQTFGRRCRYKVG